MADRGPEPLDAFSRLQQKVELTVALLERLRTENARLSDELRSTRELLARTQADFARLEAERAEVCRRIEAVLTSLGPLGLEPPNS